MKRKILLVDDSQERRRSIAKIVEARGDAWELHNAGDVHEAKLSLKSRRYDLLLLDINLPKRASRPPQADGGLEVLRWLRGRGNSSMPASIVALTEFEESQSLASSEVSNLLWRVVYTKASGSSWKSDLSQTLKDIEVMEQLPFRGDGVTYKIDILIVTALAKPELSAVLDLPAKFTRVHVPFDASDYYQATFERDGKEVSVVAVAASDKGLAATAIAAMKGIYSFWPRYLVMPGITAGIKGRTQIGDVIFSDLSWDWGSGKIKKVGKNDEFLPAPYQRRLDETVSRQAKSFSNDNEFMNGLWSSSENTKPSEAPSIRVGAMASGASVLQSSLAVRKVISQHKDLLAIEMEAFSLMFAGQTCPSPRPIPIVAKSVCDNGDGKKNDKYQLFCAEMSAHAIMEFALRYLSSDSNVIESSDDEV